MEGGGWAAVALGVVNLVGLIINRSGSKKDKDEIVAGTASQTTSNEIRDDVKGLLEDVALLKKVVLNDASIDHRSPKPKGEKS